MNAAARTNIHHGGREGTAPSAVEPIVEDIRSGFYQLLLDREVPVAAVRDSWVDRPCHTYASGAGRRTHDHPVVAACAGTGILTEAADHTPGASTVAADFDLHGACRPEVVLPRDGVCTADRPQRSALRRRHGHKRRGDRETTVARVARGAAGCSHADAG